MTPKREGNVVQLLNKLPPHFRTQKINDNRTAPLPNLKAICGSLKEAVQYKSGTGKTRHMMLHLNLDTVEWKISSPKGGWSKPVTREALTKGINEAGAGKWAPVSLEETMIVRLNRHELLGAIHKLESKLPKKQVNGKD